MRIICLEQIWQASLRAHKGAAPVYPMHQIVAADRRLECSGRADRTRVVDQNIDASKLLGRFLDCFADPPFVPDIDNQRKRPATFLPYLLSGRVDRASSFACGSAVFAA